MTGVALAAGSPEDRPSPWPDGGNVVFLLDAADGLERSLLEQWVNETRPADGPEPAFVRLPSSRRGGRAPLDPSLEAICAGDPDAVLAPLRVIWLPGMRDGTRRARPVDLLLGDPRDPGLLRSRWIRRRHPDRVRAIAAEPATVRELRDRWRARGLEEITDLASFVHRQALFALERRERQTRGSRYKIPRLVKSEILNRPGFRASLRQIAAETGESFAVVLRRAEAALREMAAAHSPLMMDLLGALFELVFSRGYEAPPDVDSGELERIVALNDKTPIAFLFSHRSHLDGMAMYSIFHRSGLPPSHMVGGDNMAVFPLGVLGRRSGVVFIRRSFRDDPVYRTTLRRYVDYLLEKRFTLSWAIEGTRSRSGKLGPPRLGMLAYVVDAWRRGRIEDIVLVPVSISYDQIVELSEYGAEQKGARKRPESMSWFLGFVSGIHAPHGRMYVRFGETLSLAEYFGPRRDDSPEEVDERGLDLQKLAFDVSVRINRATRVTPSSLVSLALLAGGPRALSLEEVAADVADLAAFTVSRALPGAGELDLSGPGGVRAALDALVRGGVVQAHEDGHEPVFAIREGKHLAAAYYRNGVVHYFLAAAIAELALMGAGREDRSTAFADPRELVLEQVARLRDLLKFEFFFPDRAAFETEVLDEIARTDPGWEERLRVDRAGVREWFDARRPLVAHGTLRPFLEGYGIVAAELGRLEPDARFDETSFLSACLGLGSQRVLQGRISSPDAVSRETLRNGLRLVGHRNLLEPGSTTGRRELFDYTRELCLQADAIHRIAANRHIDPFS